MYDQRVLRNQPTNQPTYHRNDHSSTLIFHRLNEICFSRNRISKRNDDTIITTRTSLSFLVQVKKEGKRHLYNHFLDEPTLWHYHFSHHRRYRCLLSIVLLAFSLSSSLSSYYGCEGLSTTTRNKLSFSSSPNTKTRTISSEGRLLSSIPRRYCQPV